MEESPGKKISDYIRFFAVTVVAGILVPIVNCQIQNREVEIKELEQLGKFVEHALNENIAVRKRFAVYFSKVTSSKNMRGRWLDYKSVLEKEEKEILKKVEQMEKKETEKTKKVAQDEKRVQETKLELQKLKKEKESAKEATDKERIKKEVLEKQIALKKAETQRERNEKFLAQLQYNIFDAKEELVFPKGFRGAPWFQPPTALTLWGLPKKEINRTITGWVYLGKYDAKQQLWLNPYFDIPTKDNPKELAQKNLMVKAISINVWTGVPIGIQHFGKVFDALKRGETVTVLEIENWKKTGSIWARVRYLR